jgi:flagellar basal body-associated protein FliL
MTEDDGAKTFLLVAIFNLVLLAAVFGVGLKRRHETAWDPCGPVKPGKPASGPCSDVPGSQGGPPEGGPIVRIDDVTVQLKPFEEDRYVHLSVGLEVDTKPSEDLVSRRASEIRDAILRTFADRTTEQLRGSEGLTLLKQSLMKQLRQIVPGQRIRAVYLTQFAIL